MGIKTNVTLLIPKRKLYCDFEVNLDRVPITAIRARTAIMQELGTKSPINLRRRDKAMQNSIFLRIRRATHILTKLRFNSSYSFSNSEHRQRPTRKVRCG